MKFDSLCVGEVEAAKSLLLTKRQRTASKTTPEKIQVFSDHVVEDSTVNKTPRRWRFVAQASMGVERQASRETVGKRLHQMVACQQYLSNRTR